LPRAGSNNSAPIPPPRAGQKDTTPIPPPDPLPPPQR
jgi:hypothetical protein